MLPAFYYMVSKNPIKSRYYKGFSTRKPKVIKKVGLEKPIKHVPLALERISRHAKTISIDGFSFRIVACYKIYELYGYHPSTFHDVRDTYPPATFKIGRTHYYLHGQAQNIMRGMNTILRLGLSYVRWDRHQDIYQYMLLRHEEVFDKVRRSMMKKNAHDLQEIIDNNSIEETLELLS